MGLLRFFTPKAEATVLRLPQGSFSVDPDGSMLAGTLPSSFPAEMANLIATAVLAVFRSAGEAHLSISSICIQYPSLKITAREMRGGAMIFLTPKALPRNNQQ